MTRKSHPFPPPVGTPWTPSEIEKGRAYRTDSDNVVIPIEICYGCRRGFDRGDAALGYASGHGLCFSCSRIDAGEKKQELLGKIIELLRSGPLSTSSLSQMLGHPFGVIETEIRKGLESGEITRDGKRWGVKA